MRYADLKAQTEKLPIGRHLIYEYDPDAIFIENAGQRHEALPQRHIYRLVVRWGGRDMMPRYSDLFTDLLLKVEARPDLRLSLLETCEQICSGAAPSQLFEQRKFPHYFRESGETKWARPTTIEQTAGLPTELFLCTLQGLILVLDHNDPGVNAPAIFRHGFNRVAAGDSIIEVIDKLAPLTPVGKRYYDLSQRT